MSFYEDNAKNFSKTRVNPWPATKKFLDEIDVNSKILDIGCGNGRNMFYNSNLNIIGLEKSKELCQIVTNNGGKVINCDMVKLPFSNDSFDNILCVAVYHHLDNDRDRKEALNEMYRVLKPNGKLFMQVWAMEQPFNSHRKFTKRNENVSWNNKNGDTFNRYYHIYPKGELEKEILKFEPKFKIVNIIYEEGNWINILSK